MTTRPRLSDECIPNCLGVTNNNKWRNGFCGTRTPSYHLLSALLPLAALLFDIKRGRRAVRSVLRPWADFFVIFPVLELVISTAVADGTARAHLHARVAFARKSGRVVAAYVLASIWFVCGVLL